MNRRRFGVLLLLSLILLSSCETDFEVTSEWKDITVVYGVLDQTDSIHFIKIYKAFLGTGSTAQYANIEDSSGYGGKLDVKLRENRNGTLRDIVFDTTSVYNKEPGMFYYPHQLLYKSAEVLHQDGIYSLNIRNKVTGKQTSATTPLIKDFNIEKPSPVGPSFEFERSITNERKFIWVSAINGLRYQINVRFYFKESSAPGDTIVRMVEWFQDPAKSQDATGGEKMTSSYYNEKFFATCTNYIPYANPATEAAVNMRQVLRVDFIFTVIGVDFNTYLDFNDPLIGLSPDKPEYSNITNGIGVFSCRFSKTISRKLGQFSEYDLIGIGSLRFIKNPDNY
jgi:hypothetical protein